MKFSGFFCSFIAVAAFACTECAARTLVVEENEEEGSELIDTVKLIQ